MAVSCMRNASANNYKNSSFIVDVAIGQIPRSAERISSFTVNFVSYLSGGEKKLKNWLSIDEVTTMSW